MDALMGGTVHTPSGSGEANTAFGLPRRFHVSGTDTSPSVWEEDIPNGAGPPRHIHHAATEIFVLRSGRLLFEADGAQFEAGPGDTVTIPPGTVHAFKGLAPEGSVAVIVLTPGAGDAFFRQVESEGLSPETDMPRIVQIASETDLEFAGPPL